MNWIQLLLIVSVLALSVYLLRSRSSARVESVGVGYAQLARAVALQNARVPEQR